MTHLYIEQATDRTEEVNSSIISKLYELAISGDLDNTSDLKGRLHTTICKDVHYNYLNNNFDELYISADTLSITFEDPDVENAVADYLGTDGNVLLSDIQTFITSGTKFGLSWRDTRTGETRSWTTIYGTRLTWNTFNEFRLFEGVTKINNLAFKDARQLESIQLPTTVDTIMIESFMNTQALTSIDLSNIKYLYSSAFKNSGLTGVINLPEIINFNTNGENNYGGGGCHFQGCTNITEINLGANLEHFESLEIFRECTNLTKVSGLSNLTSIPVYTFFKCSNISDIDIDWNKITTIQQGAFQLATSLAINDLSIPNLTSLGNASFSNTGVKSVSNLGSVTVFDDYIFDGCTSLTSVVLPSNTTTLKNNVFNGCTNLTTINLPTTITEIKASVFRNTKINNSINLPNLTSLGSNAFQSTNITEVVSLGSITLIGSACFYGTKLLSSVMLPNTLVNIVDNAFKESHITSINLPTTVTVLGNECFRGCEYLEEDFDLSNITSLGINVFMNCKKVNITNLPRISTYPSNAFFYCANTSINIPKEVTSIGESCFNGNTLATSIQFESNSQLTSIGPNAFRNCSSVTTITLPEGLSTVGNECFKECSSLVSIDFPSTITSIGQSNFMSCSALTSIIIRAITPPTINNTFYALNNNAIIYVPAASVSAYQSAWSSVASRIQAIPT